MPRIVDCSFRVSLAGLCNQQILLKLYQNATLVTNDAFIFTTRAEIINKELPIILP